MTGHGHERAFKRAVSGEDTVSAHEKIRGKPKRSNALYTSCKDRESKHQEHSPCAFIF